MFCIDSFYHNDTIIETLQYHAHHTSTAIYDLLNSKKYVYNIHLFALGVLSGKSKIAYLYYIHYVNVVFIFFATRCTDFDFFKRQIDKQSLIVCIEAIHLYY